MQNKVCNILLTGLIPNVTPDYIPNISELARLFWRHCNGSKTGKTNEEVDEKITTMMKVRIAHLRLATVVNFLDSDARHVSQWDQIDTRLELLRQQPANYTKQ